MKHLLDFIHKGITSHDNALLFDININGAGENIIGCKDSYPKNREHIISLEWVQLYFKIAFLFVYSTPIIGILWQKDYSDVPAALKELTAYLLHDFINRNLEEI